MSKTAPLLAIWLMASLAASCKQEPEPAYQELYEDVEAEPFDMDLVERAVRAASRADSRHSQDRWAYILGSYANLRDGYTSGSSFKRKNYQDAPFEEARRYALKVHDMCPERAECLIPLVRIHIVEDSLEPAKQLLNQAYLKDTANFYVWFYRSQIEYRLKAYDLALTHLDEAQRFVQRHRHKRWILDSKIDIAHRRKDYAQVEAFHREIIALYPEDAYAYGNFGEFLLHHGRAAEAKEVLEKAVALRAYPIALQDLQEAKDSLGLH